METVRPARESGKPHPAIVAALAPLVALLAPLVRDALTADRQGGDADPWIDQEASPLGRRAHCRACASGAIPGARKVKRRWLARRSAIDAYIAATGRTAEVSPAPLSGDVANDAGELDAAPTAADVNALLHRVNLRATAPRIAGRGRR